MVSWEWQYLIFYHVVECVILGKCFHFLKHFLSNLSWIRNFQFNRQETFVRTVFESNGLLGF